MRGETSEERLGALAAEQMRKCFCRRESSEGGGRQEKTDGGSTNGADGGFRRREQTSARRTAASSGASVCRPPQEQIRRPADRARELWRCRHRKDAPGERTSESTANREPPVEAK